MFFFSLFHFDLFDFVFVFAHSDKGKEGYEATAKQPKKTTTTANYANQNDDVDDEEEDPFASSGDSDADYNGDSTSESDH